MKKLFYVLLMISATAGWKGAAAQSDMETQYFADGHFKNGNKNTHDGGMDGSTYLYDSWAQGQATLSDGKTYGNMLLKFDEVTQTLIFKYTMNDSAMVFQYPPVDFKMQFITGNEQYNVHFLNGFNSIDKGNCKTFYQVLADGKTRLVKRNLKTVIEHQDYTTNATTKIVTTKPLYYIAKGNQLVKLKTDTKSVLAALNDMDERLKVFIENNGLDMSKEADITKVFDYYNTF